MSSYESRYNQYLGMVEQALGSAVLLPSQPWPEQGIPEQMAQAMRYSLLSGGKRLRPVLLLAAYHAFRDDLETALPFALAVEFIHTYSLIHDDLPAMDNDDLRRGKPTSHKAFGEATAILAGDALLTEAFALMARSAHPKALEAIRLLAGYAGPAGMIAGQAADIAFSGKAPGVNLVRYIHRHKTADLMTAPILMGLSLAGAGESVMEQGKAYGGALGLAFQITDDLLDLRGDPALTGKQGKRDEAMDKMTWPAVVGEEQAMLDAREAIAEAASAAAHLGRNADFFKSLALSIPMRVK